MTSANEPLKERLAREMRDALKAGEKVRLGALRMLLAAVKNREVELRRDVTDDELQEVAGREVKRRTESVEAFRGAGREELAQKEEAERDVLQAYAPAQLSEAEIDAVIDEVVATTGASGPGDMGKVMGQVMARVKGRADGSAVQGRVRQRLASG